MAIQSKMAPNRRLSEQDASSADCAPAMSERVSSSQYEPPRIRALGDLGLVVHGYKSIAGEDACETSSNFASPADC